MVFWWEKSSLPLSLLPLFFIPYPVPPPCNLGLERSGVLPVVAVALYISLVSKIDLQGRSEDPTEAHKLGSFSQDFLLTALSHLEYSGPKY